MVQLIFVVKEFAARFAVIIQRRIAQKIDVAARTKPTLSGVVYDHAFHFTRLLPMQKHLCHSVNHVESQRVESSGLVQADNASMPFNAGDYVVGHWCLYAVWKMGSREKAARDCHRALLRLGLGSK